MFAEVVATCGLLDVIFGVARSGRPAAAPFAVGASIAGCLLLHLLDQLRQPGVTVGRTLSNTFAGIAPSSTPALIAAQLAGGVVAVPCVAVLYPGIRDVADDVLVPHDQHGAG